MVAIAEINNVSGCEGYGDFTNLIANLAQGSTNDITFTTGYGDQNVKVWIDFNDNYSFAANEVVVPNFVIAPGQGAGSYTVTVDLNIPAGATIGEHRMRVKSNWQAPVGNDACNESTYGETEDYTANIGDLGVNDTLISESELIVISLPNNQFEISLRSDYNGTAYVGIYNLLGQQLGFKTMSKVDNMYRLNLNMSYAASGVYLIRVGGQTTTSFKTGRIIVK